MTERPLLGKVAIVTGAGSPIGMGYAMTLGLVRAGARVAMIDVKQEWLDQSGNQARELGGDDCVLPILADVSDPESVQKAVGRTISELGGLHILVNNAGVNTKSAGLAPTGLAGGTNFWETSADAFSSVVSINFSGAFFMASSVVTHMIDQGWGRIIGVTTSMDSMWRRGGSPYGPSKAGHEALVAIMAQDLEGTGVTANVLIPGGGTHTNMTAGNSPYAPSELLKSEAMQAPVVWLASEDSGEVTGQRLIAYYWDESMPIEERLEKCSAPAAWPQLGLQMIHPRR